MCQLKILAQDREKAYAFLQNSNMLMSKQPTTAEKVRILMNLPLFPFECSPFLLSNQNRPVVAGQRIKASLIPRSYNLSFPF